MLKGKDLGAAIDAARIAKGVSKVDLAKEFGVSPPSVHGWITRGSIDKDNLFALMRYFVGTVGSDHWGMPAIEGVDPRLTVLITQLSEDLKTGLLDEDDIRMLSGLAIRIAGRNG